MVEVGDYARDLPIIIMLFFYAQVNSLYYPFKLPIILLKSPIILIPDRVQASSSQTDQLCAKP